MDGSSTGRRFPATCSPTPTLAIVEDHSGIDALIRPNLYRLAGGGRPGQALTVEQVRSFQARGILRTQDVLDRELDAARRRRSRSAPKPFDTDTRRPAYIRVLNVLRRNARGDEVAQRRLRLHRVLRPFRREGLRGSTRTGESGLIGFLFSCSAGEVALDDRGERVDEIIVGHVGDYWQSQDVAGDRNAEEV